MELVQLGVHPGLTEVYGALVLGHQEVTHRQHNSHQVGIEIQSPRVCSGLMGS